MLTSMTGFAARTGLAEGYSWSWELRSVNGKGLDLRLRMPDWLAVLEPDFRKMMGVRLSRGNVALGLRISKDAAETSSALNLDALNRVLDDLQRIEDTAGARGVTLTPASASDVLNAKGVTETGGVLEASDALKDALRADFALLLDAFCEMRASEGAALTEVIRAQLAQIEDTTNKAAALMASRAVDMQTAFRTSLDRVLENADALDETRLAQEIALLTVKSDVTEEIDRLTAHVAAAQTLIAQTEPIGRKLDFLCQEFNREANTLCSKAQHAGLTEIGLALKVLIDQMREQVQNVE